MGGTAPSDSVATGKIELIEGSSFEVGNFKLLVRGLEQTLEEIQTAQRIRRFVYSHGRASEGNEAGVIESSFELALSSQNMDFPLPVVASVLANPDAALEYVGLEKLNEIEHHHIRFWLTYPSTLGLRHLEEFSVKHIWIAATTGLPSKLAYEQRAALGPEPPIARGVAYADYRNVGGVLCPYHLEKSLNGTPWATIIIDRVLFNQGLPDATFQIEQVRP
jgi:hypothetical protein